MTDQHTVRDGRRTRTTGCSQRSPPPRPRTRSARSSAGWLVFIISSSSASAPLNGTLENKFAIPGSDAQKATDVLEAKFGERNGAILQVVFDAEVGQARHAGAARRHLQGARRRQPRPSSATEVTGPFADNNQRSRRPTRASATPRCSSTRTASSSSATRSSISKTTMKATLEKAGIKAEYTGDAEQAPPEAGSERALGFLVALLVLLIVFRTLVAAGVPIVFAGHLGRLGVRRCSICWPTSPTSTRSRRSSSR